MTYTSTRIGQATCRETQPISRQVSREVRQDRFLIVGCGNSQCGDSAAGPLVAMTVSRWGLNSVKSMVVDQLDPNLALNLSEADYAIFIESCSETNSAQTAQICPVCIQSYSSETIHVANSRCGPETLLLLAQQLYDSCPQSWLIKIPTEGFETGQKLSSTAQTGMNRALKTIAQFLKTYRQQR